MVRGRWFCTPHAVRQFIDRCAPGLSYEQALDALIALSLEAKRGKVLDTGATLWRGPKPTRLRCYVQERVPPGALPQLLTVVLGHDRRDRSNGKEEVEG